MSEIATVSVLLMLTYKHECNSKNKTFNSHRNCLKTRREPDKQRIYSGQQRRNGRKRCDITQNYIHHINTQISTLNRPNFFFRSGRLVAM